MPKWIAFPTIAAPELTVPWVVKDASVAPVAAS